MFRNQYDTDVTVWSPEGRLLQVSRKKEIMIRSDRMIQSALALSPDSSCCEIRST